MPAHVDSLGRDTEDFLFHQPLLCIHDAYGQGSWKHRRDSHGEEEQGHSDGIAWRNLGRGGTWRLASQSRLAPFLALSPAIPRQEKLRKLQRVGSLGGAKCSLGCP